MAFRTVDTPETVPPTPTEHIDPADLGSGDAYRLLTGIITPRPIAWVSTEDGKGGRNLAPFSYFQAVCSSPPTIMLSVSYHSDGRPKDTLRNILETGEFTISHVGDPVAEAMNVTSASLEPEHSEWDAARVAAAQSTVVRPPRVAAARAAMECRLTHAIPVGRGKSGGPSTMLVLGEVVAFHLQEGMFRRRQDGRVENLEPADLESVGRLGGPYYCHTGDVFSLSRPAVEPKGKGK